MTVALKKWGNSLALRIPKDLLKTLNVENNSLMELSVKNGVLIVDFLQNSMKEYIPYCTSSFILNLFELAKASPSNLQNKI